MVDEKSPPTRLEKSGFDSFTDQLSELGENLPEMVRWERIDQFKSIENKIAQALREATGNSALFVELSANDEQEMLDGDWNSPPFAIIYDGQLEEGKGRRNSQDVTYKSLKVIERFSPFDRAEYEKVVEQLKK